MRLRLDEITLGNTQTRVAINPEVVADYAERMQADYAFDPVVVFTDGRNKWLADGYHRVEAARACGRQDIDADVRDGDRPAALWYALGANRAHGLRMGHADVRKAIGLALRNFPARSNREIARQVGCSHNTVADERAALESTGQIDQLDKTTGADGKARCARRDKTCKLPVKSVESVRPARYVRTFSEMTTDELRRNFECWRDQMEGYCTLEEFRGKSAKEISARCGMPIWEVERILDPAPPTYLNWTAKRDPGCDLAIRQHNAEVEKALLLFHALRFKRAAWYAEQEGDPRQAKELAVVAEHYDRKMAALKPTAILSAWANNKELWARAWLLTIDAYRAAIGIEVRPEHEAPQDYVCAVVSMGPDEKQEVTA